LGDRDISAIALKVRVMLTISVSSVHGAIICKGEK
jgi:hypothetical protein